MASDDPYIDPRCAALLVLDMQKGFCHPDSQMEKAGFDASRQRAIIPDLLRLVEMVRTMAIPVFWTQQVHFPEDVARRRRRIPSHIDKTNWAPALRGTWEVDFMPEIAAAIPPEDFIVEKHRASAFLETTLPAKLRMLGVEQLIIAGINTEFCVESTVRDAYFTDFDVILIRDCIAGHNPRFHEDTLAKVEAYWGAVISLKDLPAAVIPEAVAHEG